MTLYFEEEGEYMLPLECRKTAEEVIEAALDIIGCPYEAEVSILLTMNDQIQEMNTEFRGIERPTDVLEREDCFNPETGELSLGDIVISKEKVTAQAEEYGHSILREYAFLIVHSVLHLTGFDHMEEKERKTMEEKQKEIMDCINILR